MFPLMSFFNHAGKADDPAEPSLAPSDEGQEEEEEEDLSTAFTGIEEDTIEEDLRSEESLSLLTFETKEFNQQSLNNPGNQGDAELPRQVISRKRKWRDQKADQVHSVFADPYMWRYLDHFQIECLGSAYTDLPSMKLRKNDPWVWFERESVKETNVVLKVEATALSKNDIHSGIQEHDVPGSNAVGVVHHCSPSAEEEGVKPGMRVAVILQPSGSNARYFSLSSSEVLPIGRHLDAADIACITTAYLPAFQALHHGRVRPYRYSRTCLEGRNILIVGGHQLMAQASVRLAQLAGAKHVYICAPRSISRALQKTDAFVLDENPCYWPEVMEGEMDIVIDFQFPKNFADVRATVARKGRLVCCNPDNWNKQRNWWPDPNQVLESLQLSSFKRATFFDFRENSRTNRYELKEDLQFLLTALTRRQIRPDIDRYVKLEDAPSVYRELNARPMTGSVICEPWRE